jgi:hypothetical protein
MRRSGVGQDAVPADVPRKHGLGRPGVRATSVRSLRQSETAMPTPLRGSAFNGWTRPEKGWAKACLGQGF